MNIKNSRFHHWETIPKVSQAHFNLISKVKQIFDTAWGRPFDGELTKGKSKITHKYKPHCKKISESLVWVSERAL